MITHDFRDKRSGLCLRSQVQISPCLIHKGEGFSGHGIRLPGSSGSLISVNAIPTNWTCRYTNQERGRLRAGRGAGESWGVDLPTLHAATVLTEPNLDKSSSILKWIDIPIFRQAGYFTEAKSYGGSSSINSESVNAIVSRS